MRGDRAVPAARYPRALSRLTYLLDGDGGDENLKSYPLEDSDLTLSSVLRNPLLYQEGWGVDAIKHSLAYSAACRAATCAPTRRRPRSASRRSRRSRCGRSSPRRWRFRSSRSLTACRAPATLKQDVVCAGIKAVTGIEMPVKPEAPFPGRRAADAAPRVTKAWCRRAFNEIWQERVEGSRGTSNGRSGE